MFVIIASLHVTSRRHVGGQEHLSALGTKLYFHVNSPTWPPCHMVANQEYEPHRYNHPPNELINLIYYDALKLTCD